MRRQIPHLHVLSHPLSKNSHGKLLCDEKALRTAPSSCRNRTSSGLQEDQIVAPELATSLYREAGIHYPYETYAKLAYLFCPKGDYRQSLHATMWHGRDVARWIYWRIIVNLRVGVIVDLQGVILEIIKDRPGSVEKLHNQMFGTIIAVPKHHLAHATSHAASRTCCPVGVLYRRST